MREKKSIKKRNWAFVAYPESLPLDWIEMLQLSGLQCAVSPLHDKDLEPDNKTHKKPHYHLILAYSGPTSYNVVKSLVVSRLHSTNPIPLEQIRGYYRYFIHKDNPEKYQYDEKDIKTINGFDIREFVELTKSEIDNIKRALQALIRKNGIIEYADLMDYLFDESLNDEYSIAANNTLFFTAYLRSNRHKNSDK